MDVDVRVMDVDVWVVDVNVRVIVYMSLPGCISLVHCCWDRRWLCWRFGQCRGDVVMPPAVAVPTPGDLAMCELIIIHHKTNTSMSGVGELFLHCRWPGYLRWLCRWFVRCRGYVRMSLEVAVPAPGGGSCNVYVDCDSP